MAFVYAWIVSIWADQLLPQEFIIFDSTDYTEIFPKLRSAGLNYNLPSFFTDSYCVGGGYLISIAY